MASIYESNGHGYTATATDERPLSDLFQDLGREASNLVSLELDMVKAEMGQKASVAGKSVGFMAAGGFVAYAGFLAIVAAIILALATAIPAWLSALIVGVVVAIIGYVLLKKGMNDLKKTSLAPTETLATLKEDKNWAQEQVR